MPLPGALKLNFNHTDDGLMVKRNKLVGFSVAGKDHQWHWDEAKIEGDAVIVSSKLVPVPQAARYAGGQIRRRRFSTARACPPRCFGLMTGPGVTESHQL
jgi:sialate O-acetylesterase